MKHLNTPTESIALTAKCVLTLFNMSNASDWSTCRKFMGTMDFLKKLKGYDKEDVPINTMNKVRSILESKEFDVTEIKKKSQAAGGIAFWCKSVYDYNMVMRTIRPKEAKWAEMTVQFNEIEEELKLKDQEIHDINAGIKEAEIDLSVTNEQILQL
jgi:dynein heavy chain, axonemal